MPLLQYLKDLWRGVPLGSAIRSKLWPTVRGMHIRKFPACAVCNGQKKIEVHHIQPFHLKPELELEPSNLITLCESKANGVTCHQFFGHLGNYKSINPTVVEDAKIWRDKLQNRN